MLATRLVGTGGRCSCCWCASSAPPLLARGPLAHSCERPLLAATGPTVGCRACGQVCEWTQGGCQPHRVGASTALGCGSRVENERLAVEGSAVADVDVEDVDDGFPPPFEVPV